MPIRPWTIGLFIIGGFGLFTAILFMIGDQHKVFNRHVTFYAEFTNLGGIANGGKVSVSGLDAGEIKSIAVPKDAKGKFRLELQVQEKMHPMVRQDSVVSIQTQGVVGDKFVSIKKGSSDSEIAANKSTLPSKEPVDITEMMDKASGLLKDVQGTIGDVRGRVDLALDSITKTVNDADGLVTKVQPNIQQIASNGSAITAQLNHTMTELNQGKGSVGLLLRDDATRQQIQDTLAQINQSSVNLKDLTVKGNQVVNDFQNRQLVEKTDKTLEHVQAMSAQLDTTIHQALADDNLGQNGAANLRQTLSNLNVSTKNLAEDTEALKHNFLLRGFFKKRGYFNTEQLTPEQYRELCEAKKSSGPRMWLNASNLFVDGQDGHEQLSDAGEVDIDVNLANVVDSLPSSSIVVEGYSTEGSPSQQFVRSVSRANLVRRYLQMHYHLPHDAIVIVPMRDKPPEDTGRDTWNGAAMNFFARRANR